MGFRAVVILNCDLATEWENDKELGKKISRAMHKSTPANNWSKCQDNEFRYGKVVECTHADTETLAVIESLNMHPLAFSHWWSGKTDNEREIELLKSAADKLGFRLVKKPTKKIDENVC